MFRNAAYTGVLGRSQASVPQIPPAFAPTARTRQAAIAALRAQIAGLSGNLEWFQQGRGLTIVSSAASTWASATGSGRSLGTSSAGVRPLVQSDGSLLFDGVDDLMKVSGGFAFNNGATVYMRVKQVSWTASDYLLDGDSVDSMVLYQNTVTPQLRAYAGAFGTPNGGLAIGTFGIVTLQLNGASSFLRINAETPVVEDLGAQNPGGLTVGAGAGGAGPSNIQVGEILVRQVVDTEATQALIRKYLNLL